MGRDLFAALVVQTDQKIKKQRNKKHDKIKNKSETKKHKKQNHTVLQTCKFFANIVASAHHFGCFFFPMWFLLPKALLFLLVHVPFGREILPFRFYFFLLESVSLSFFIIFFRNGFSFASSGEQRTKSTYAKRQIDSMEKRTQVLQATTTKI
jgi:energy-coupling factor transporter transmembrane protein EcfT